MGSLCVPCRYFPWPVFHHHGEPRSRFPGRDYPKTSTSSVAVRGTDLERVPAGGPGPLFLEREADLASQDRWASLAPLTLQVEIHHTAEVALDLSLSAILVGMR